MRRISQQNAVEGVFGDRYQLRYAQASDCLLLPLYRSVFDTLLLRLLGRIRLNWLDYGYRQSRYDLQHPRLRRPPPFPLTYIRIPLRSHRPHILVVQLRRIDIVFLSI